MQSLITQNMRGNDRRQRRLALPSPRRGEAPRGTGDATVTHVIVYDNGAKRASGHDEKTILTLKAQKKPLRGSSSPASARASSSVSSSSSSSAWAAAETRVAAEVVDPRRNPWSPVSTALRRWLRTAAAWDRRRKRGGPPHAAGTGDCTAGADTQTLSGAAPVKPRRGAEGGSQVQCPACKSQTPFTPGVASFCFRVGARSRQASASTPMPYQPGTPAPLAWLTGHAASLRHAAAGARPPRFVLRGRAASTCSSRA